MINLHERMLPTSAGVEPVTSWSPVGRRIQLSHRGRPLGSLNPLWFQENRVSFKPVLEGPMQLCKLIQDSGFLAFTRYLFPRSTVTEFILYSGRQRRLVRFTEALADLGLCLVHMPDSAFCTKCLNLQVFLYCCNDNQFLVKEVFPGETFYCLLLNSINVTKVLLMSHGR